MNSFKLYVELNDAINANTDDITFTPAQGKLSYTFNLAEGSYRVKFSKYRFTMFGMNEDATDITLSGPDGVDLTGFGNGTQVYRQLIRAVKKFVENYNPKILHFHGVERAQDVMYDTFYQKFLKPYYTRLDVYYLSNEWLDGLRTSDPETYAEIQRAIEADTTGQDVEEMRNNKAKRRQEQVQAQSYVGKIVVGNNRKYYYIKSITNGRADGIGQAGLVSLPFSGLEPVRNRNDPEIQTLVQSLRERGINAQL